jgi:dihydrofolate reductase
MTHPQASNTSALPILHLIAAMAHDQVIGFEGTMPWHSPEDLAHFKALTSGQTIIMGRKTFDSLGRLLPNRRHIVITRQTDWSHEGVAVAANLLQALTIAGDASKAFIIGGAQIYTESLPYAQFLHLTYIDLEATGDTRFPIVDWSQWHTISDQSAVGANGLSLRFVSYERIQSSSLPCDSA